MIYLNLEDGLGNQLFQYSFARSLQEIYGEKLIITLVQYNKKNHVCPEMKYSLKEFKIPDNVILVEGIRGYVIRWTIIAKEWFYRLLLYSFRKDRVLMTKIANKHGLFFDFVGFWVYCKPFRSRRRNKYITGRFQSEKYFLSIGEKIKNELTTNRLHSDMYVEYVNEIKSKYENTVAVHIRRGDYLLKKNSGMLVCDEKYYSSAVERMSKEVPGSIFYIFTGSSEDREWIKNNYLFLLNYECVFVDTEDDAIDDLMLLSQCKNFILSNSSFSWWGQYLSKNNGVVFVPSRWNSDNHSDCDVYRDGWIKIG